VTLAAHSGQPLWLRIIRFPIIRLVVLGPIIFFMMLVNNGFMATYKGSPPVAIGITVCMALAAIAVYFAYGRIVEGREVTELSTPKMGREWAAGAIIGTGLIASCFAILGVLGMYRVEGLNPVSFMAPGVAMALSAATFEELFFRGVLLKSIEDLAGSWIALVVASTIFGATHLMNPEGTIVGAIYVGLEGGLLLAAGYLFTRRLWLAMGMHMAWNYVQSGVFSGVVSGSVFDPGLFKATFQGPDLLTGGRFGVESSIIALAVCTAAGIVLAIMAHRRGHILPPPGRTAA
jgi:uncharacterized protein